VIRPSALATIRRACSADAASVARVYVESWRTAYAGLLPDDVLIDLSLREQEASWRRMLLRRRAANSIVVAELPKGGVVGFGSFGRAREPGLSFEGEIYTLYVDPDHQGEGLGKRLLETLFGRLLERGMENAVAWVLADNPARFFYEAMGGTRVATRSERLWGGRLPEVAYGWPDLHEAFRLLRERR
jgi:ribosomal protein S18 acetylase RimI-like enzyme